MLVGTRVGQAVKLGSVLAGGKRTEPFVGEWVRRRDRDCLGPRIPVTARLINGSLIFSLSLFLFFYFIFN